MALVVITVGDTSDGQVAVNMLTEPAVNPEDLTPAQATAMEMINTLHPKEDKEPSRILQLNP